MDEFCFAITSSLTDQFLKERTSDLKGISFKTNSPFLEWNTIEYPTLTDSRYVFLRWHSRIEYIKNEIQQCLLLKKNWDSYGAREINTETVSNAIFFFSFLSNIIENEFSYDDEVFCCPTPEGDIEFEIKFKGNYTYFSISSQNTINIIEEINNKEYEKTILLSKYSIYTQVMGNIKEILYKETMSESVAKYRRTNELQTAC